MAGAPYRVDFKMTDDETFGFTFEWLLEDGSDFPWAEYTYRYEGAGLTLTGADGVTYDPATNLMVLMGPVAQRFGVGEYPHGLTITNIANGRTIQVFDGIVSVTQGNLGCQ